MTGVCVPNVIDNLLKIDSYYAQKFANLVQSWTASRDGGTLLDNTVAVWTSDFSDGCAHNLNNMPIIQAGSGGAISRPGRSFTSIPIRARPPSRCWAVASRNARRHDSDGRRPGQGTGTESQYGNAPVNKYYCNLMNAMWPEGGRPGLPRQERPGERSHSFGYSDKTEDFCGGQGAVSGATIHDPARSVRSRRERRAAQLVQKPLHVAARIEAIKEGDHGETTRMSKSGNAQLASSASRHARHRAGHCASNFEQEGGSAGPPVPLARSTAKAAWA